MQIEFQDFIDKLSHRLKLPLPGALAHEPLRAIPANSTSLTFNHQVAPKLGSVLILLHSENGVIKFPLTKRATYKGAHSGQISLPGGKTEVGETKIQTALRECEEEIGVRQTDVNVVGALTNFFVIPSNFMVTPIVAYVPSKPRYVPDPIEVDTIFECSISELIPHSSIKKKEIIVANEFKLIAPHFEIGGEIVWGATAMMLNEFRTVVRELLVS